MLNQFPPGGAPPDINRQLPQGLSVPGLQQQSAGTPSPTPYGQVSGTLSPMSGLNGQPPLSTPGGMPGGGMLGMPPPGGMPAPGGMPGAPGSFGMPGGTPQPGGLPPPNMMGGGLPTPGGASGGQGDVNSYVNALTKPGM